MPEPLTVGQTFRTWSSFNDDSGAPADPATVTLRVRSPSGVTAYAYGTAAEVVRDAVGAYHACIPLDEPGTWYWRWETGGPLPDAAEGEILVRPSRVL